MSSPSPEPPLRELAPPGPIWGSWGLAATLVATHVLTAILYAERARTTVLDALIFERSVQLRVTVGGQYGPLVAEGQVWRLVRSVGLHADALHLIVNCIALVVLGRLLEPWVGAIRLWWWFALGGVAGSVASQLAGLTQSDGASGGAFALLGAMLVLGWRHRNALDAIDRRIALRWLPGFLILNVAISLILPFVDAIGHLGGLAAGVGIAAITRSDRPDGVIALLEGGAVVALATLAVIGPAL